MGTRTFKWFYRAHLIAGIFVSVHCLVLFLSGALLLFKDELSASKNGTAETFTALPDLHDAVLRDVTARFPQDRPLSFALDEGNPRHLQVRLGRDGSREFRSARRLVYDVTTASEVTVPTAKSEDFFEWLLELHRDLLMGANGKLYVGFVGLVFLFTLISGFIIYGNFVKKLSFGAIRRLTWRSLFSDLHKFVGVSLLFWGLLIGATGTLLAFNSTLLKIYQYTELRALNAVYGGDNADLAGVSVDRVVAAAKAARPDGVADFIAFPGTQFSVPSHFIVLMHGNEGFSEKLLNLVLVGTDGRVAEVRELPLYMKALVLSEPLHFGDYGGWPLKIMWLLFTLVLLTMPVTGLIVLARRNLGARGTAPIDLGKTRAVGAPWNRPYLLPAVFFLLTAIGVTVALVGDGAVDAAAALIGVIPVVFVLAMWRLGKETR